MIDLTQRMALSPTEVAEVAHISRPTVYELIKRQNNPLPSFKIGRKILIPVSSLTAWLEQQTESGSGEGAQDFIHSPLPNGNGAGGLQI